MEPIPNKVSRSQKTQKPDAADKLEKKQLAEELKRIKPGECLKVTIKIDKTLKMRYIYANHLRSIFR